jgi:ankyrin
VALKKLFNALKSKNTKFREAVFANDTALAQNLLDQGADINDEDSSGHMALTRIVTAGNLEMTRWLYERGARRSRYKYRNQAPLLIAASWGHQPIVEYLLQKGEPVDQRTDYDNQTPLMLAAEHGYAALVRFLLDQGADAALKDREESDGWGRPLTALDYAVQGGHEDAAKILREYPGELRRRRNDELAVVAMSALYGEEPHAKNPGPDGGVASRKGTGGFTL